MPLPLDTNLALQGHSKPGDTQCTQPKKNAMLFRLSSDAMARLADPAQASKSSVVFGDKPGLYIGDEFFPFRISPEAQSHELYLLSVPKNKTATSLKLYANVTAKAHFVERKLDAKTSSSVRERTEAAEKQRTEAKIKILDAPPPAVSVKAGPATKKRKDATTVRRVTATNGLSVASSSQPSRVASPRPSTASSIKDIKPNLRRRFVHYIALQPRTKEDIAKRVFGADEPLHRLPAMLEELCERVPVPKGTTQNKEKWQLKTQTWLEVTPFVFPPLQDSEKVAMARHARTAFYALKIPESDPVWQNVKPKATGSSTTGSGSGTTEAKRPAISDQRKTKLSESAAARKKANEVIVAKDEGARVKAEKAALAAAGANGASASQASLRRPGSGYVAKSHTPTPPAVESPPKREAKKEAPAPVRPSNSAAQSSREVAREHKTASSSGTAARPVKKERDPDAVSRIAESDRESRRGSPLPTGLKRKKVREDREREEGEYEPPTTSKRRKVEDSESGTKARAPKDLTLPKRPSTAPDNSTMAPPRQKYKKEPSSTPSLRAATPVGRSPMMTQQSPRPPTNDLLPPLPSSSKHDRDRDRDRDRASAASVRESSIASRRSRDEHSRNGSAKPRRKSPIYTSSDEDEKSKSKAKSPKTQPAATSVPEAKVTVKHEEEDGLDDCEEPPPLPEEPREIQRLYQSKYPTYVALYYLTRTQKARIDELIAEPIDPADPTGVYGTDEDVEMVNGGFKKNVAEYNKVYAYMLDLQDAYWKALKRKRKLESEEEGLDIARSVSKRLKAEA
ncbi:hypothetical protein EIP86_005088 [Pleurotus ostreatoroseus]|nr:hypothetical protein EIP86_005088 [Pleurotus ostreatoroseus]